MKHVKMVLYGEPGVGKSTFASKAPRPFFICTDANYEWLDLPKKDHIQINSWDEAKKAFNQEYNDYDTIVVDLVEDLFKWCEYEFCNKNRLTHISDLGYGKGYDLTRTEFFIEISKLLNKDKNIILIMHGLDVVKKDRRAVEYTVHIPSTRIPDKVLDMIEGRVRYFLRCYLKAEEVTNKDESVSLIKKRYLSLIPKENEYGICRGIDETKVPQDIPLDFDMFYNYATGCKVEPEDIVDLSKVDFSKVVPVSEHDPAGEPGPKAEPTSEFIKEATKEMPVEKEKLSAEDKISALKRKMEELKKNKEK